MFTKIYVFLQKYVYNKKSFNIPCKNTEIGEKTRLNLIFCGPNIVKEKKNVYALFDSFRLLIFDSLEMLVCLSRAK